MRQPFRSKGNYVQVSTAKSYPAPVGGWNAKDALADMKSTDAITLDNWYPRPTYCEIRGGYTPDASSATGLTGTGKTLAVYNSLTGTNKLFCYTTSGVYDVSSPGIVGAAVATRTDGKHQWTMFGDGTNNYLIAANGVDKILYYDGTTWLEVDGTTTPALTGLATTSIISVFVSKGRLFFIEKSSLSFWYLAAGAAGGALTEYDLSGVAKKGGFLMAGSTWTVDAGDGPDDQVVLITSEGEVIVYAGTNPSSATTWALVGVFDLGKPLGRRCVTKFGSDLVILTQNGAFPMAAAMPSASLDYTKSLSYKIENAFNEAARTYGSVFGWKAISYPNQSALIVNVPHTENGEHVQYVMNTINRSWCRFLEWDAEDFAVFNGDLYFCTGTKVVKAWTGTVDGINDIEAYGKTAFSYFNSIGTQKKFKLFRPVLAVNGSISFLADIDVDFQDNLISGTAVYSVVTGAQWDVSNWDEAYWASELVVKKRWTSPSEWQGYCAAAKIKIATNSLTVQWLSSDWIYETGGML